MPAKPVAELPPHIVVTIRPGAPRPSDVVDGEFLFLPVRVEFGNPKGDPFEIGVATLIRWDEFDPAPWIMENGHALHGWGPLIYDFAMEFATQNGRGLVACGRSTNDQATPVWKHYYDHRQDDLVMEPLPAQHLTDRRLEAVKFIYRKKNSDTMDALAGRTLFIEEPCFVP